MQIRLATPQIQPDSVVDGEGIRAVIWTQGCPHHCPGCHNPETHSFTSGFLVDIDDIKHQLDNLNFHTGITLSGGDPFMQVEPCLEIAKYAHHIGLDVWCYTGFTYEELLILSNSNSLIEELLNNIDVLVDGKFKLEEKSYDAIFRGSKNQRIIDTKKSLDEKRVVQLEKYQKNNSYYTPTERKLYI